MSGILIIRHGEAGHVGPAGAEGFKGRIEFPLTGLGRVQARAVARRLLEEPARIEAVYAGPLARAVESARPAAEALGLPVVVEPDFDDMDFGEWSGMTVEEVRTRWPEEFALWMRAPSEAAIPSGEGLRGVLARSLRGIESLSARHDRFAVFTHRVVAKLLVATAASRDIDSLREIEISPGSISELEFSAGCLGLHGLNETSHLDRLGERA